MTHRSALNVVTLMCGLMALLSATPSLFAQSTSNPNCTIIVPDAPLTAAGLATPYQLVATDPTAGPCDESNTDQSAFVQAAVFDPATGAIYIYNPLVITQGSTPAASPAIPTLPANAVVALWFGYDGDTLTLQANPGVLHSAACVNGTRNGGLFGQFAYCNAPAFFWAAHHAIHKGQLIVPSLGTANDGKPCPSVRDFMVVDQDQSDNLPASFLVTQVGLAQTTQANIAQFQGAAIIRNPSDEGLLSRFLGPALGCSPWKAADLADPGQMVPALALNELQAAAWQKDPIALVPAGDPMVLRNNGHDLFKVDAYRAGVDQPFALALGQASTTDYCRNMVNIAPPRLLANQAALTAAPSPVPADGNNLFTFLAQRFVGSFDILGCGTLLNVADPVSFTIDANGTAISAVINAIPPIVSHRHRTSGHRNW
jgi:hypothetical protein